MICRYNKSGEGEAVAEEWIEEEAKFKGEEEVNEPIKK